MTLYGDRYTVDFQIDHTYTLGSVDNRKYDIVLNPEQLRRPNDCICLSITVYGDMPRMALLITNNYAGGTPSAVLEDDMIVILCDCYLYKLRLDALEIILRREIELYGCSFELCKAEKGWIIYGEMEIIGLDSDFNKIWSFSGHDIFVSCNNECCFEMTKHEILLCDWQGSHYALNYDGSLLREWK